LRKSSTMQLCWRSLNQIHLETIVHVKMWVFKLKRFVLFFDIRIVV